MPGPKSIAHGSLQGYIVSEPTYSSPTGLAGPSKSRALFSFQRSETRRTLLALREADGELSRCPRRSQLDFCLGGLVPAARAIYARPPDPSSPWCNFLLTRCAATFIIRSSGLRGGLVSSAPTPIPSPRARPWGVPSRISCGFHAGGRARTRAGRGETGLEPRAALSRGIRARTWRAGSPRPARPTES